MKLRTAGLLGLPAAVVGVGWWFLAEPDDLGEPDGGRSAEATAGGNAPADDAARDVIAALFADRRVVQIPALDLCCCGGGIHCITQQQAAV